MSYTDSLIKYAKPIIVKDKQEKTCSKLKKNINILDQSEVHEILNKFLPPKEWTQNGQLWRQCVSTEPAKTSDVLKLNEQLRSQLTVKNAKDSGLCEIRRKLYNEVFDELIRQVTVNCVEQGFILLKIRDEYRNTMKAFERLYESSISYGMRKIFMGEESKRLALKEIKDLKEEEILLNNQLLDLRQKYDKMQRRGEELRIVENKKHEASYSELKVVNSQLKLQLESIISPKEVTE